MSNRHLKIITPESKLPIICTPTSPLPVSSWVVEPFRAGFPSHSTNIHPWSGPFLPPSWLPYIPHQTCQEILLAPPSNTSRGLSLSSTHLALATSSSCIFLCVSVNPKLPIYPSPLCSPLGFLHPFHCLVQGQLQEAKETCCLEGFSPGLSRSPRDCKPHPQCTSIQGPRARKEPNKICSTEEWLHYSRTSGKTGSACQNLRRVTDVDAVDVCKRFYGGWSFLCTNRFVQHWVQFSHSVVSDSLRPHESQHARPPCPSPTSGVHSDSHPSSQWCHPAISSSVVPFSSCP